MLRFRLVAIVLAGISVGLALPQNRSKYYVRRGIRRSVNLMSRKKHSSEALISKLRETEVLQARGNATMSHMGHPDQLKPPCPPLSREIEIERSRPTRYGPVKFQYNAAGGPDRGVGLIFLACLLLLEFSGCHVDSSEPTTFPLPKKPTEYAWTYDTLAYPGSFQTVMTDIWGSSATDVYVVGHNSSPGMGAMYHFDGQSWSPVRLLVREGGTLRQGFDLSDILGFGPSDVWAVGEYIYDNPSPPPNFLDSSLIIHFDGARWTDVPLLRSRSLTRITGRRGGPVTASGLGFTVYELNGTTWESYRVPFVEIPGKRYGVRAVSLPGLRLATVSAQEIVGGRVVLYAMMQDSSGSWAITDSQSFQPGYKPRFGSGMFFTADGALCSLGDGVFRWRGGQWERFFDRSVVAANGPSPDALLIVTSDQQLVLHCAGITHPFPGLLDDHRWSMADVLWIGGDIFVVAHDGRSTIVMHGR
jgi:hypothetical protein